MKVTIVGSGYVGLTTGSALAFLGHQVSLLDIDETRIMRLRAGEVPIHERGLPELMEQARSNMRFFSSWDEFDPEVDVVIVAVGTPEKVNGDADLTYVEAVAHSIGERLTETSDPIVVNKSTVPIGSATRVKSVIEQKLRRRGLHKQIHVASNPEFLREGEALFDTFYPDRIVIGVESDRARDVLSCLYAPLVEQSFVPPTFLPRPADYENPPLLTTNPTSAELIKYAANSFLAMKISFINEFAHLAEQVGADIREVAQGIGLDKRIGTRYLNAGIGWGGSCFGKDTSAILYMAKQYGVDLQMVRSTVEVNKRQRERIVKKLQTHLKVLRGKTIGLLGLSFKPNTDDLRDAPALDVIWHLHELGAHVKVYDPIAMENCKRLFPDLGVQYEESVEELFEGVHAVVLLTEWREFRELPYAELGERMFEKLIVDGRNVLDMKTLQEAGFVYSGIGRGV
jgi:UDPglucose 6-dehydrogenase